MKNDQQKKRNDRMRLSVFILGNVLGALAARLIFCGKI